MALPAGLLFTVDKSQKSPAYEQISNKIRYLVHSGSLIQNTKMPPTRALAQELGVSRSTVVTAYEQLVAEGYIEGRQGAGYVVCTNGDIELTDSKDVQKTSQAHIAPTALRPLTPGQPDMELFPHRQWAKTVARVCRESPELMLTGADRFGNLSLRQSIANHVLEWRGIETTPEQIIITSGATEALNICIRTLTKAGDEIGIENPGYSPIPKFIKTLSLQPTFLNVEKDGIALPKDKDHPKLTILTPSHQYPLGGVLPLKRRMEFIHWANTNQSWIVEDDYDCEFRYSGRPSPAIASIDKSNRTLYIGSFSKVFSDSLRLGYLIAPTSLLEGIRKTMDTYGMKAGLMPQQALSNYMDSGEYYRHLRRIRKVYNDRRQYLRALIKENLHEYGSASDHPAGMQLVFHLDTSICDTDISSSIKEKGITLDPLSIADMTNQGYNGFILGFSSFNQEEMKAAVTLIKKVLSEH